MDIHREEKGYSQHQNARGGNLDEEDVCSAQAAQEVQ
jgi:hypothetical protein